MPFIGNKPTALPLSSNDLEDNIITSAKIVDGTIATADISDGAVTSVKTTGVGGTNTPSFQVLRGTSQLINENTDTVVAFDTEIFDTDNAVSSGVFTVPSGKAGKYFFAVNGGMLRGQDINVTIWLSKNNQTTIASTNGDAIAIEYRHLGASNSTQVQSVSGTFDLAVGDTVRVYIYHTAGNSTDSANKGRFTFSGHKLIG